MAKIKTVFGWFGRVGTSILIIAFLMLGPFTFMPSLLNSQANINRVDSYRYQGILELWHIETFEGGSASRSGFLERQAIAFEKENKGTYIVVKTMTPEQLKLNLQNNSKPNMLSFGIGVEDIFVDDLCKLDFEMTVRSDILQGGKFNNELLAMPYILGGYAFITQNNVQDTTVGKTGTGAVGSTNPFKACASENIKVSFADNLDYDTYNTYDKYLKGNYDNLLGTQRDVYRISNRVNKGVLSNVNYKFLSGYTDLVQYISIFKTTELEQEICKDFVKKLVSDEVQNKLANINLFSVLQNKKLYTDDIFGEMENCLNKTLKTENVFLNQSVINAEKDKYFKMVGARWTHTN